MRVLLDHCVDCRFSRALEGHDVENAQHLGWDRLKNGKLLTEAAQRFDVVITVDRHLRDQQNLKNLPVAVVVLGSKSNRLADLLPLAPLVLAALPNL